MCTGTVMEKKDEAVNSGKSAFKIFKKNKGTLVCLLSIVVLIILFYITYRKAKQ